MVHRRGPLAALALVSLLTFVLARAGLEPEATARGAPRNPAWLPSGKVVRAVSLGQRLTLADIYWMRAVQYMGETLLAKAQRWEALYPLVDIVTDLDPRFAYAYQVTGSNLAALAHRYDDADRILQKGMRNLPDRWSLPFTYATNKFLFEQDYPEAARYARRAAEVGKRPHLALLAANLSALANTEDEYRTAELFLQQTLAQTDTPGLRDELAARLTRIRTYQVLSDVERAIAAFQRRTGRRPLLLTELLPVELAALPVDPSGGEILYDAASGAVKSSVVGPRAPLRITREAPSP